MGHRQFVNRECRSEAAITIAAYAFLSWGGHTLLVGEESILVEFGFTPFTEISG